MNSNEGLSTFTADELKSIIRFTQLLSNTHSRVSSNISASKELSSSIGKGLIDKLVVYSNCPISKSYILDKSKKLGFEITYKNLRDKNYYLVIHSSEIDIYCCLYRADKEDFSKISLNPSMSSNYTKVESILIQLFGPTILMAKVYRLDFTVDIYRPYEEVLRGLDIKNKSAKSEYLDKTARTGIIIGTQNDKILIYDKSKEQKSETPRTRIERQLSGPKVPIQKLMQLRMSLPTILDFNPLGIISLHRIRLKEPVTPNDKFHEFKALIKHEGFFFTRKKLNKNNNFKRDYGKFYSMPPHQYQPSDYLKSDLTTFFKDGGTSENLH
jgi:hypothetical protein